MRACGSAATRRLSVPVATPLAASGAGRSGLGADGSLSLSSLPLLPSGLGVVVSTGSDGGPYSMARGPAALSLLPVSSPAEPSPGSPSPGSVPVPGSSLGAGSSVGAGSPG